MNLDMPNLFEDGLVSLVPERDPQEVYAGNVSYAASNGWQITIFNDANEWDYIDNIRTSNGDVTMVLFVTVIPMLR